MNTLFVRNMGAIYNINVLFGLNINNYIKIHNALGLLEEFFREMMKGIDPGGYFNLTSRAVSVWAPANNRQR